MNEKCVGIFWYHPPSKRLIGSTDKKTLSEMNKFQNRTMLHSILIAPHETHMGTWDFYNKTEVKEPEVTNYMYYPRGRVSFLPVENVFEVQVDKCIFNEILLKSRIAMAYNIPLALIRWVVASDVEKPQGYSCYFCNENVHKDGNYKE